MDWTCTETWCVAGINIEGKNYRRLRNEVYATNNEGPGMAFLWRNNEKGDKSGKMENHFKPISGLNTKERMIFCMSMIVTNLILGKFIDPLLFK